MNYIIFRVCEVGWINNYLIILPAEPYKIPKPKGFGPSGIKPSGLKYFTMLRAPAG